MTTPTTPVCIFSGDGAGAMARLDHVSHPPVATDMVYGVASNPLPACLRCARAWARDGFTVRAIEGVKPV